MHKKMPLVYPAVQMSEVVEEHPSLIPVINRFGIRLGFGDKSVQEICIAHQLDVDFFLTVINTFLHEEYFPEKKLQSFHTSQIVDYLAKTNRHYLLYQLPNIERHLTPFINMGIINNQTLSVGKFFSSFKEKLIIRIKNDAEQWFPYCLNLSETFKESHRPAEDKSQLPPSQSGKQTEDAIEEVLADLKRIIIKHLSGEYDDNLCYAVIFGINSLEKDIKQHNRIRYKILNPMVAIMEKKLHE
jgi:regulator of cell morphogenesis and NO signaling